MVEHTIVNPLMSYNFTVSESDSSKTNPLCIKEPEDEELITIGGDARTVFNCDHIPASEVIDRITLTELDVISSPETIIKYFLILETMYVKKRDVAFLLKHVYTPSDLDKMVRKLDMNVAFLDMCTPNEFRGTIYEKIDNKEIMGRVETLIRHLTQMDNIGRMYHSFGSDNVPTIRQAPGPDELERDLKPQQKLLNFLFQRAGDMRLRRKNSAFYRPKILYNGVHTGFFEYYCEINEFIYKQVSPARLYPEYYDALTNKPSTPQQMVNLITGLSDPRCPFLVKNRELFSFNNGVFNARDGSFTRFEKRLDKSHGTSQFFDFEVTDDIMEKDPFSIDTPLFEKILLDQSLDDCARRWMYILCGRLLHDVGTLDDWQVTLYIRGVAGSGKSTILKVMGMLYEADDIGYLMSDGQSTFSDEHLYDKFIVAAMDMDKKTLFSATRINSMTSGEKLSVNRKFKTTLNIKWKPPMVMASNAQPPWEDVAGNLVRRFVIFLFNNPVRNSDPQLFEKLHSELPLLLIKMSRMYLEAIDNYGNRSLWEKGVLPKMCHEGKRQYLVASNPLSAFLESDHVVFQEHDEVPANEFRRRLIAYTRENCDRRAPTIGVISKVDHSHLFAMYGCKIIERTLSGGTVRTFIDGLSLAEQSTLIL